MAIITRSTKFVTEQDQSRMTSGKYVLLRIVKTDGTYTVMTATAAEDDGSFSPHPNQGELIQAAKEAFALLGAPTQDKRDAWGRAYIEFSSIDNPGQIRHAANKVAAALGLDPVSDPWADEELREIWEEFSVDDEDDAYLSDGMYATRSRGFLEK